MGDEEKQAVRRFVEAAERCSALAGQAVGPLDGPLPDPPVWDEASMQQWRDALDELREAEADLERLRWTG